jgi:hypothetical protein
MRKRKAQTPPAPRPAPPPAPHPSRLEEKLDDLVSILRTQFVDAQAEHARQSLQSPPTEGSTPSTMGAAVDRHQAIATNAAGNPDVVIDTAANVVLLRPGTPPQPPSCLDDDVSAHRLSDELAEEQLGIFRRAFLTMFPGIHVPQSMPASELRRQKPFLWLVIMTLTHRQVSEQFAMEETIWTIISRRVVSDNMATIDLLLGIICFATWCVFRAYSASVIESTDQ